MGMPNMEDKSVELEQTRAANADRAQKEQAGRDEVARQQFAQRVSEAYTGAQGMSRNELVKRGLDPDKYMSPVEQELARVRTTIPQNDPSPGAYFTPDLVTSVLNREQDLTRTRNTNKVNEQFKTGFEKDYISDTADDPLIDKIIGEEYDRAKTGVDAAYKRGNLNDAGYNFANTELDRGRTTGKTTVGGLGDAVLNRYRGDITGVKDKALTGANSYTLGGSEFDLNPFTTEAQTKAASSLGNLEGDLRGAAGSAPLFNVGSILQKAGGAQGPINPRTSGQDPIASVLAQQKKNTSGQGVGSTGAF